MSKLNKALKKLISVKDQQNIVNDFAEKKFNEENVTSAYYEGFDIVSENKIRVNYGYGEGFSDSFEVDIEPGKEGPYDYFGLLEDWQIEGERIEPRKEAMFEGCGDRALEGVMFIAKIEEDGNLSVRVDPESEDYFNTLNTKMWLKSVLKQAEEEEFFYGVDDDEEFHLVRKDGAYSVQ